MTIKKSIGWTDMTLNPLKGKCKGGCWYCYYSGKRGILNRFKQDPKIRLHLSAFNKLPKVAKRIFLCSTHDLFGSWIPKMWRDEIFEDIKLFPQHIFQVLTKFPQNIDREMPDNVWLGISVTNSYDGEKICMLHPAKAKIKFISFEPLLRDVHETWLTDLKYFNWIIIGRLTGYGNKHDPKKWMIEKIIDIAEKYSVPVFLKDNLIPIMGENLIQEMPDERNT